MAEKDKVQKKFSSSGRNVSFVILIFVSLISFLNIFVLALNFSSGTERQAIVMSQNYSDEMRTAYLNRMNALREKTNSLAVAAGSFKNRDDLDLFFYNACHTKGFVEENIQDIRYFANGTEYTYKGKEITDENKYVLDMKSKGALATYGVIYYAAGLPPCVVCYSPIPKAADDENTDDKNLESENTDDEKVVDDRLAEGIVVFFPQSVALDFSSTVDQKIVDLSAFQAVCYHNDQNKLQILRIINDKEKIASENNSFEYYLKQASNNGISENITEKLISSNKSEITTLTLQGELYVLSVARANATDQGTCVVTLYKASDVYSEGYDLVISIITTMVLLAIVFVVFGVYYVVSGRKMKKRLNELNMVNTTLNCPTLLKFEKEAKDIFARNKRTKFAVVISHIHHFNYLTETYKDEATTNLLQEVKETFFNALMVEETYGYINNGEFILLLHYKEKERLENRLVGLYAMIKRYSAKNLNGYDLKMCYGIYEAQKNTDEPIQRMVEKAMVVRNLPSRSDVNQICHFYDDSIKNDYLNRAEIEGRMEGALASGEFRVFYQPKYNFERNDIDGAELLVRWYDPAIKKYRKPNEFLPVFESNGFISKLDRHIYYTACETLTKRIAEGKRIFPISVNVSRVTAIQPDFIAYYLKVKNYFKIADGFITLEFTESFAYENYEHLSSIAKELRKGGFHISIDDFGTGYSSYNILKTLEIDEIKMDKLFLDAGISAERDRLIIESVIDVSKKMRFKITQEGVETIEQLRLLKDLGCSVIQGYYFAKPMSLADYDKFIEEFYSSNKIEKDLK